MSRCVRGQAFIQDLIIAVFILSLVIVIYFNFYNNQNIEGDYKYYDLVSEAKTISDYLVSQGYPLDWNESNVVRLGITNGDNVLNFAKLDTLFNITSSDYDKTRGLLKTKYDYIFFFRDINGNSFNMSGNYYFGKPGVNDTNIDGLEPKYLTKIRRYVITKVGDPISADMREMIIYVWSEKI